MFQATRNCGVDKGKQRRKQAYHNPSRVKGLKRNNAAKFRAINPGDFRLQARTVYSLGRKYEISAPVHWPSNADPMGACERQCANIDAGEQAPPIRSRSANGGLCGPETWTWEHEE
jgi:hypothetical protein